MQRRSRRQPAALRRPAEPEELPKALREPPLLDAFVVTADRSRRNRSRLALSPEEHPVGAQLMGSVPEDFPPAALRLGLLHGSLLGGLLLLQCNLLHVGLTLGLRLIDLA